jgi:hypothetical protein
VKKRTTKPPVKTPPLVEVLWQDAFANPRWMYRAEAVDLFDGGCLCATAGYMILNNSKGIILACSVSAEGMFGSFQFIPRGMVKEIRRL